jgi:hypothetical protein
MTLWSGAADDGLRSVAIALKVEGAMGKLLAGLAIIALLGGAAAAFSDDAFAQSKCYCR